MAKKAAPEKRTNLPVNISNSPADDGDPTWSPDGTKIAFQINRTAPDGTSDYDIWWVRAADGANPTNLTNTLGNDTNPAWQSLPERLAVHDSPGRRIHLHVAYPVPTVGSPPGVRARRQVARIQTRYRE